MQMEQFFYKTNPSRLQNECDQRAAKIIGVRVHSSEVHGASSYIIVQIDGTVGPVVRFRTAAYAFGLDFRYFIEQTYGNASRHWKSS
jgi:hypothetical protein